MPDRFDQQARSLFLTVLGQSPQWATLCGFHEHDDELPEAGPDAVADRWNELRRAAAALFSVPADGLSAAERVDVALVRHVLEYAKFSLLSLEGWKKDPDALSEIGLALCIQMSRDYAPADQRMDQIAGRLDKLPDYLDAFRQQVLDPVPLWTELAIATTGEMPGFFQAIAAVAERSVSSGVRERLNRAVERAARATDAYYTWLVRELRPRAAGEWVLGPETFGELCRRRELDRTPAELRELGTDLLARGQEDLQALAHQVKPNSGVAEALEVVYVDRPRTFRAVLKEYLRAVRHTRRFLADHDLITLPDDDVLEVAETPPFLAPFFPVAGYLGPGWFEGTQAGTYFVTPPPDDEALAALHNAATIYNTTVHEAFPGHHVQTVVANAHAPVLRLLPELYGSAVEYTEGWALYCEHLMAEEGFLGTSQRRLVQMRDHCLRAARVLVDVGLQTGEMTVDEGVQVLQTGGHMPAPVAQAEVQQYTRHPGYFLSYLLGTSELIRLRDDLRARMGNAFSLRWFHDTVLRSGPMPLTYVRRLAEAAADGDDPTPPPTRG